ncbi:NUDIX domain-containing protein [Candidatus Uhrbacteria bacterium]|nr:NUDIX domain-containing protein [Candidatus Uhrbacteria bacterium]
MFHACGIFYNPDTRSVLLQKRDDKAPVNPNKWCLFGGGSEGDETPEQTFIREMKEELNIELKLEDLKKFTNYLNPKFNTHRYVYLVESRADKSSMTLNEGEDFDWISLDRVFEYDLTESTARDVKTFLSKLDDSSILR